jgi:squalene synthase HpnC
MSFEFDAQLAALGPGAEWPPFTLKTAQRFCRQLATAHYENFLTCSLLLPRTTRQDFYSLYAYCRWADDIADEVESSSQSLQLLDWWEELLADCRNSPRHPVFIALGELISRHDMPTKPFSDLLIAFRQDQTKTRYQNIEELLQYCRYSANPVGQMVLHLGNCWTTRNAADADLICTALQLVNFWQDVSRDFAAGRVYLPHESMATFDVSIDSFPMTNASSQFRQLLESEVDRAAAMFDAGESLALRVPPWLRTNVDLFVAGGRAVIAAIRAQKYDVWTRRPVVGRWRKLNMLARATARQCQHRLFGGAGA